MKFEFKKHHADRGSQIITRYQLIPVGCAPNNCKNVAISLL